VQRQLKLHTRSARSLSSRSCCTAGCLERAEACRLSGYKSSSWRLVRCKGSVTCEPYTACVGQTDSQQGATVAARCTPIPILSKSLSNRNASSNPHTQRNSPSKQRTRSQYISPNHLLVIRIGRSPQHHRSITHTTSPPQRPPFWETGAGS